MFKDRHYSTLDLKEMGKQIALALLVYNNVDISCQVPSYQNQLSSHLQFFNKNKILEELLENKQLLLDSGEDSSGSDSDPSEDNFEGRELDSIIKITSSYKVLEMRKKQLRDLNQRVRPISNNREHSNKALSVPRKGKCNLCGEYLALGHACTGKQRQLSKDSVAVKSATTVYVNANGKKVRDQATQTVKTEEIKTVSPLDIFKNGKSRLNKGMNLANRSIISEDVSSLGRLWRSKHLPNLKKISNVKYSN